MHHVLYYRIITAVFVKVSQMLAFAMPRQYVHIIQYNIKYTPDIYIYIYAQNDYNVIIFRHTHFRHQ